MDDRLEAAGAGGVLGAYQRDAVGTVAGQRLANLNELIPGRRLAQTLLFEDVLAVDNTLSTAEIGDAIVLTIDDIAVEVGRHKAIDVLLIHQILHGDNHIHVYQGGHGGFIAHHKGRQVIGGGHGGQLGVKIVGGTALNGHMNTRIFSVELVDELLLKRAFRRLQNGGGQVEHLYHVILRDGRDGKAAQT